MYIIPKNVYATSLKLVFIFVQITCKNSNKSITGVAYINIGITVCVEKIVAKAIIILLIYPTH